MSLSTLHIPTPFPHPPISTSTSSSAPSTTDLRHRIRSLLLQQRHTDCSFHIDGTVINSHRLILAAASPVFDAMFYGPLAETGRIRIDDCNAHAFRLMLEYIYTDQLDATSASSTQIEDLIEVYYCAKKYLITDLQLATMQLIRRSLRPANILRAIDAAVALHIAELIAATLAFFSDCCRMRAADFQLSREALNCVLVACMDEARPNVHLVCLVQRWLRTEALRIGTDDGGDVDARRSMEKALHGVRLPSNVVAAVRENLNNNSATNNLLADHRQADSIMSLMSGSGGDPLGWRRLQRKQFRAVRPLGQPPGQRATMCFRTTVLANRYVAIRSVRINSRLAPAVLTSGGGAFEEGYTERVHVVLTPHDVTAGTTTGDGASFEGRRQSFVVCGAEYNSTVCLAFDRPVIVVPDVRYALRLDWPVCDRGWGREYPRSLMAAEERMGDGCALQFDGQLEADDGFGGGGMMNGGGGSVLVGLEFAVMS